MSDLESTVAILKEFFTKDDLARIAEAIAPATIPGPPWTAVTILRASGEFDGLHTSVLAGLGNVIEFGECLVCGAAVRPRSAGVHASWHNRGCK